MPMLILPVLLSVIFLGVYVLNNLRQKRLETLRMPSSSHLAHILRELGWNEGFTVPIASAENHALECEVRQNILFISGN